MTSEESPDSYQEGPKKEPPDLPDEITKGKTESRRQDFSDINSRPDLLRLEFAGPDSIIDYDTPVAQRVLRYFDFILAQRNDLFEGWNDLASEKQRMVRAAVVKEYFDGGHEDLEKRLRSSSVVTREIGFNPSNVPSDTTLWRGMHDLDDDVIEEAARRANNALLHV